ncbi:MAG: hypothetical protein JSW25_05850 [Thermoplasmata archaeon]|nr:MAG: hypothetical protein JSW25_05850 [Thermoplasmata archaeon]
MVPMFDRSARGRLMFLHFVGAMVCSAIGSFLIFYWLEPQFFLGVLIVVGVPVGVTGSFITHLTLSLDDLEDD